MEILPEKEYETVLVVLDEVDFCTLFARCVLVGHAAGVVFASPVQNKESQRLFYICSHYGMTLLCGAHPGDCSHDVLRWLQEHLFPSDSAASPKRTYMEWLQVSPTKPWSQFIHSLASALSPSSSSSFSPPSLESFSSERVNYSFSSSTPSSCPSPRMILDSFQARMVLIDGDLFDRISGSVAPRLFWRDRDTWTKYGGLGYCILATCEVAGETQEMPVCWSFSSVLIGDRLEIGIETVKEYQGKGLAKLVAHALIALCRQMQLTPIWTCRRSNIASCRLAASLGFVESVVPSSPLPYFHLPFLAAPLDQDFRLISNSST